VNFLVRLLRFIRRTTIALHVCLLEERAAVLDLAARNARRYSRDVFLSHRADKVMRLEALEAWGEAGRFERQAEDVRAKIKELIHAAA
jgi:hypothetical protein